MINYTYNDFEKALEKSGLAGTFSQADMELARNNPNAGMSILNYKLDYNKATTDEGRYLANIGAENVRKKYGSYTGGTDGSGYYFTEDSPSSFIPSSKTPEYKSEYSDDITSLYKKQKNYGDFVYDAEKPVYIDRYGDKIEGLLSEIENTKEFSYNPTKDPLYGTYRKQYLREGKRATEDTMGSVAAMTSGIPSSFAVTAAAQAGNYYNAQLADKMPQLYELAYNQHLNELNTKLSKLNVLRDAEKADYARYLDELNAFNNDKAEAYEMWQNDYKKTGDALSTAAALEQQDFAKYLDLLSQHKADRNFEYGKYIDDIGFSDSNYNKQLELAQLAAQYGDFSKLEALGIDTSAYRYMMENSRTIPEIKNNQPVIEDESLDDIIFNEDSEPSETIHSSAYGASPTSKTGISNTMLRRFDNTDSEAQKLRYINTWLANETITEAQAETLLKRANIEI